jgi:hypothetical protein
LEEVFDGLEERQGTGYQVQNLLCGGEQYKGSRSKRRKNLSLEKDLILIRVICLKRAGNPDEVRGEEGSGKF